MLWLYSCRSQSTLPQISSAPSPVVTTLARAQGWGLWGSRASTPMPSWSKHQAPFPLSHLPFFASLLFSLLRLPLCLPLLRIPQLLDLIGVSHEDNHFPSTQRIASAQPPPNPQLLLHPRSRLNLSSLLKSRIFTHRHITTLAIGHQTTHRKMYQFRPQPISDQRRRPSLPDPRHRMARPHYRRRRVLDRQKTSRLDKTGRSVGRNGLHATRQQRNLRPLR